MSYCAYNLSLNCKIITVSNESVASFRNGTTYADFINSAKELKKEPIDVAVVLLLN